MDHIQAGVDALGLGPLEEPCQRRAVGIVEAGQDQSTTHVQEVALHRDSMVSAVMAPSAPMLCSIVRSPSLSTATSELDVGSSERHELDVQMRRRHGLPERAAEDVVAHGDDQPRLDAHAGQHAPGSQRGTALRGRERVHQAQHPDGQRPGCLGQDTSKVALPAQVICILTHRSR